MSQLLTASKKDIVVVEDALKDALRASESKTRAIKDKISKMAAKDKASEEKVKGEIDLLNQRL